ncbi:MAG: LamG domain-containing protein [Candidatus Levybacteria bacterium]|nr:LamG domain-containing protein [Candidatus Levybacteria bacterium]
MGTYDGTNCKIYIDGVLNNTATCTGTITVDSGSLVIGGDGVSTNRLSGQIDEVKVFNYPLTATQVKTLYNNGAVNFGPNTGAP